MYSFSDKKLALLISTSKVGHLIVCVSMDIDVMISDLIDMHEDHYVISE